MIKVSIIVPIYNVEKYLNRCVDSILGQTFTNFEVILVNDGSTDSCDIICNDYAKREKRVTVVHQSNMGLPAARNSGLKLVKGDYVGFIDSDDKIDSDMLEEFIDIAKNNNFPDIITSDIFQYSLDNLNYSRVKNDSFIYKRLLFKDEIMENYVKPYFGGVLRNLPSVCTKLYKASFIRLNNLVFDESLVRAADYWYNLEALQKANTLYSIDKSFYHYYVIQNSNIRKYRENDFDFFLLSRKRLLNENKHLKFEINWVGLNNIFINNTNEFILLILKNENFSKGYKKIKSIFKNKKFISIICNSKMNKIHEKLIQFFLKHHLYMLSYSIYYIWSKK